MLSFFHKSAPRPSAAHDAPLTVSPEVRVSAREDGIVFLHSGTGAFFSANATGAAIWERLRRGETTEAIGSALAREFGIASEVAVRDAARFTAALEAQGILIQGGAA